MAVCCNEKRAVLAVVLFSKSFCLLLQNTDGELTLNASEVEAQ